LGGIGYSYYTETGFMLNDNDVNLTWEGDNKVLYQQTSRFILKNCNKLVNGKPLITSHVSYLERFYKDEKVMRDEVSQMEFVNDENLKLEQILQIYKLFAA
jgi:acyl-CoA oxidase